VLLCFVIVFIHALFVVIVPVLVPVYCFCPCKEIKRLNLTEKSYFKKARKEGFNFLNP